MSARQGVLLINLGSPASTETAAVRSYLNEFLMDPYVLDAPWPIRRLIVSAFILPTRPKRSAEAYRKIWRDNADDGYGSPLLHHTAQLADALGAAANLPVAMAMRYGSPSIADGLAALKDKGVTDVCVAPLYPHYADSTTTTSLEAAREVLPPGMQAFELPPFFVDPSYIEALATVTRDALTEPYDHLVMSYHGLPERHLTRTDPTGNHCLANPNCCEQASEAHATCYRHQTRETSRALAAALGLDASRYTVSYQSRLGRLPWLRPYTDATLAELPAKGVRRLAVVCPAFVADNLETLEEIGLEGQKTFLEAGGETFQLVPCLNAAPSWVDALASLVRATLPPAR